MNTPVDTIFEGKVCKSLMNYIKRLRQPKFSNLYGQMKMILDKDLINNEDFMRWIFKKLEKNTIISTGEENLFTLFALDFLYPFPSVAKFIL